MSKQDRNKRLKEKELISDEVVESRFQKLLDKEKAEKEVIKNKLLNLGYSPLDLSDCL